MWKAYRYPTDEEMDMGVASWDMRLLGERETKEEAIRLVPPDGGQVQNGDDGEVVNVP